MENSFAPYFELHGRFRLDPEGRAAHHTHWDDAAANAPEEIAVAQVLIDAVEENDWEARFMVDLAASRAVARPVLRFVEVARLGESGMGDF